MHFGVDNAQSLNLNLQLDGVDFAAMAAATKNALQNERKAMGVGLKMSSVVPLEAVEKMSVESNAPLERKNTRKESALPSSSPSSSIRSVRGIVNAGDVHDSRDTRVAYRQLRTENPHLRYTLHDALQDCALTNNWAKAFGIFDSAVRKAIDSVPASLLLSGEENKGEECAHPSAPHENPSGKGKERVGSSAAVFCPRTSSGAASENAFLSSSPVPWEDTVFSMLFNMNATSPPMPLPRKNAAVRPSGSPSFLWATTPLPATRRHTDGEEEKWGCFSTSTTAEEKSGVSIAMPSSGRVGIMRWRGFHFCALFSLLMQCHRWKEVEKVWEVLKKIGFLSFHMDEVMINRIISSIRRAIHTSGRENRKHGREEESGIGKEGDDSVLESSSLYDLTFVEDGGEDALGDDLQAPYAEEKRLALHWELDMTAKTTARKILIDTEWVAKKKGFRVHKMNAMTVQQARIAEAMRRSQEPLDSEAVGNRSVGDSESIRTDGHFQKVKKGEASLVPGELWQQEEGEDAFSVDSPPSSLPVRVDAGDFNGLLRRASSYPATVQILNVMDQLSVERTGETFANMIAALQNPLYLVNDASEEELQTNYGTDGTFQRLAEASHSDRYSIPRKREAGPGRGEEANPPLPHLSPVDIEVAKEKYERYKEKRIQEAKGWFDQCPTSMRSAMVFNEYLYLIRGKEHVEEYTRVLKMFRGNAIFVDETLLHNRPTEKEKKASSLSTSSPASPATILPPQWKTPPDPKTYEALLFRLRYLHQWGAMWELLEEMRAEKIYGTPRTYQMLISEAKVHPPPSSSMNTAAFSHVHYGRGGER